MEKEAHEPAHFSMKDFLKALFGSFVVGITFLFKGSMLHYATQMRPINILAVVIVTCIVVTFEIYILSYKFVVHRRERPFYEFWAKRFFAIIGSSFVAVYLAIYIYGLNNYLASFDMFKLASAILMPAAIAGAAMEMLKKV